MRTHLKNTIFWNLDLSSNTQSKGDLWFKCELFIVFVNFQNLNLCRDKANAKLHLNNNGAHFSFWFTYYSSRGSFLPWNHGPYSWVDIDIRISHYYRILMFPFGCRLDHWVTYTTWNGSDSDLWLKMWLTKPNGEHFIISVLWVVSEGVWFRKWTTAQKKKVCSHEAVGIDSANSGLSSLRMSDKPYVAAAKVIRACIHLRTLTKPS